MQPLRCLLGLSLSALFLLVAGCASPVSDGPRGQGGSAQVTFVDPTRFTDFTGSGPSGQADQPRLLAELEQYLQEEAGRQLAADRRLEVRVLDIDAGGGTTRGPRRVRVSDGTTTAEITVEYVLRDAAGREVNAGRRRLTQSSATLGPTDSGSRMPMLHRALRSWLKELGRL